MLRYRAFTLVELVLIIVLLGILAVSSIPNISIFYLLKFSSAGKKLVADINYAQSIAVSRNAYTAVEFSSVNAGYSVYICTESNCLPRASYSSNWSVLTSPVSANGVGVDFTQDSEYRGININSVVCGSGNDIVFDKYGKPYDAVGNELDSNAAVELEYQGDNIIVNVTPKTGKTYSSQSF